MNCLNHPDRLVIVDPPSGWMYGFPRVFPEGRVDMAEWLVEVGYPEEDVDFAMKHMRVWYEDDGTE